MLRLAADYCDELPFVLYTLGRVGRYDDLFAVGDQRIICAIADICGLRKIRFLTALSRRLDDVLGVIEPGAVERAWLDRNQQLDRCQRPPDRGPFVPGERIAFDLGDGVTVEDAVNCLAIGLKAYPAHIPSPPPLFRPLAKARVQGRWGSACPGFPLRGNDE